MLRLITFLACFTALASGATVTGRVRDARGGGPLARVSVRVAGTLLETSTNADGRFEIADIPPGPQTLQVETVGYRLEKQLFTAGPDSTHDFEIILSPETFRRTDSVEVRTGVFDLPSGAAMPPSELSLTGAELKNLGTVLMDDPLRAVHVLPGVSATNDFESRFTLRGAGFHRVGLYLDDILLHAPFHAIAARDAQASLSTFNGETMSDVALFPTNPPAHYADRSAGVLALRTREGSSARPAFRIAAGVAGANLLAEGPFARGRGTWMGSARVSYLQYLVNRLSEDTALAIGFHDVQGKVGYEIARGHAISLYVLDGTTDLDRTAALNRSGVNALIQGTTRSSLVRAGWQYSAGSLLVNAAGAWIRERFESTNRQSRPLDNGSYGEWIGNLTASWQMGSHGGLDAGWNARRVRSLGYGFQYFNDPNRVLLLDSHRGTAIRHGGFAQQQWQGWAGAIRLSAGTRWDTHEYYGAGVLSPQASLAARISGLGELQAAWGHYVQFPEVAQWTSVLGGRWLLPERAEHLTAAWERRLGGDARVRVEAWNRDDRDLIARPLFDPRIRNDTVVLQGDGRLYNSVRGYSRGVQIMLQRRSANRLSGWAGYTLSWARQRDGVERVHFWSLYDQRHIANLYLSYRLTPSLNLSGRYSYGSGEPVPGYVTKRNGLYYLAAERNGARLPAYQRLDVRANRSFRYDRWKFTLYGEVINLTNRRNMRFVSFDGANAATRRAFVTIDRVFPIVPVAGLTLEF